MEDPERHPNKERNRGQLILLTAVGCAVLLASAPIADSIDTCDTVTVPASSVPVFEPNAGQWPAQVRFVSRQRGGTTIFFNDRVELRPSTGESAILWFGDASRISNVVGEIPLKSYSNYYIGNDPRRWRSHVRHVQQLRYRDVYEGIDLVFRGLAGGAIEYDFVVSPGFDPARIRVTLEGTALESVVTRRAVEATQDAATITHHSLIAYQVIGGERRYVPALFRARPGGFSFDLDPFTSQAALVIDPVLEYSSFLGGNAYDEPGAIIGANDGSVWVAGYTLSTDFPVANNDPGLRGASSDVVLSRIGPQGLIFSTYFGGNDADGAHAAALGPNGVVHIGGETQSTDFPTEPATVFQGQLNGGQDGFVASFNAAGELVHSTYFGGTAGDVIQALAVDDFGRVYFAGKTTSADLPTHSNALQKTYGGSTDGFVARLNVPSAPPVQFSTYLGGGGTESISGLALRRDGTVVVGGDTSSTNFPIAAPYQPSNAGGVDAFLSSLSADGSTLTFSTYLGGGANDRGYGVGATSSGEVYLSGTTQSSDFPVTAGAFQTTYLGNDAFLAKVSADGQFLQFATYYGGLSFESNEAGLAVDSRDRAAIVGGTFSDDLPVTEPYSRVGTASATYAAVFSADGSTLDYGSVIDAALTDFPWAMSVDAFDNILLAGSTQSQDYPLTSDAYQATKNSADDMFITIIDKPPVRNPPTLSLEPASSQIGLSETAELTVRLSDAWASDINVVLHVDDPLGLQLPPSVKVPRGDIEAHFVVSPAKEGTYAVEAVMPQGLGDSSASAQVGVALKPFHGDGGGGCQCAVRPASGHRGVGSALGLGLAILGVLGALRRRSRNLRCQSGAL